MKKVKLSCAIILLLFCYCSVNAQKKEPKQIIIDAVTAFEKKCQPQIGENVYLKAKIRTIDKDNINRTSEMNIYGSKNKAYQVTENHEVYQTDKVTVAINHEQKSITIMNGIDFEEKLATAERLQKQQITLIRDLLVESIEEFEIEGEEHLRIILGQKQQYPQKNEIKTLEYVINMKEMEIVSIVSHFTPGSEVKKMDYEVLELSNDNSLPILKKKPQSFIYTSAEVIKPELRGYVLNDLTKNL